MKDFLIFSILLYLCNHKKTSASEIAREFEISPRSVYRYIDSLSLCGVPVITKLGRGGGIELVGGCKLEKLMLSTNEKEEIKNFLNGKNNNQQIKQILQKLV